MTFKEAVWSDNYSYQVITTGGSQYSKDWEVSSAAEKYLAVKQMNWTIT